MSDQVADPDADASSQQAWGRSGWVTAAMPSALAGWVAARLLVGGAAILADVLGPHPGTEPPANVLLAWDGAFYRVLAEHGYGGAPHEATRFFPLYPLLGRWLGDLLGGRTDLALLVIANGLALVAAVVLWRLVRLLGGDERLATGSVLVFSLFPASAALVFAYSESLAVVLSLWAGIALARRRPLWAAVPLLLAGLTRPTGVLLCVPVALLLVRELRTVRADGPGGGPMPIGGRRGWVAWSTAVVAPLLGLVVFVAWLQVAHGNGSAPFEIQRQLRDGFVDPVSRTVRMLVDVGTGHFRDVYNLGLTAALVVAAVGAVRSRLSAAWTSYLVVGLLVSLSGNVVDSIGRYGVALAPAWAFGLAFLARDRRVMAVLLATSSLGMLGLTTMWIRGYVIP